MGPTRFITVMALAIAVQVAWAEATVPAAVSASLARLGIVPTSIEPAPLPGLYEVAFGAELFYIGEDGRYVFRGDILEPAAGRNLTEEKRSAARSAAIEALGEDSMVVFAPEKTRHTVSVFTDIDCPYCRKFHQEVGELNKNGIKVRYLAFPRGGPGSKGYRQAVSVWCSDDKTTAMTDAKAGRDVPNRECDNPVDEHYEIGRVVGVTGTPALVLDNGQIVPGYVPANRLVKALNTSKR